MRSIKILEVLKQFKQGPLRPFSTRRNFPRGGTFLLFKDQLAGIGRQKTKENIISRGKFALLENDPYIRNRRVAISVWYSNLSLEWTVD